MPDIPPDDLRTPAADQLYGPEFNPAVREALSSGRPKAVTGHGLQTVAGLEWAAKKPRARPKCLCHRSLGSHRARIGGEQKEILGQGAINELVPDIIFFMFSKRKQRILISVFQKTENKRFQEPLADYYYFLCA